MVISISWIFNCCDCDEITNFFNITLGKLVPMLLYLSKCISSVLPYLLPPKTTPLRCGIVSIGKICRLFRHLYQNYHCQWSPLVAK